jgi:hypothetical protein
MSTETDITELQSLWVSNKAKYFMQKAETKAFKNSIKVRRYKVATNDPDKTYTLAKNKAKSIISDYVLELKANQHMHQLMH